MDLALDDDQAALRSAADGFLQRMLAPAVVRRLRQSGDDGHDPRIWQAIADMGWLGLALPGSVGGGDGNLLDVAVVYEEAGRALAPTTLYSTVAAALLINLAGDDAQRHAFLPPIIAGQRIASIALQEPGMLRAPLAIATVAESDGTDTVVTGAKLFVPNAGVADELVVVARAAPSDDAPVRLVVVATDAEGVRLQRLATFAGDAQYCVDLQSVSVTPDRLLEGSTDPWSAVEQTVRDITALQCVEMAGGAAKVLDMTIAHVTARSQFGRPIGSFQAVQHHVADMSMAVDAARLAAWQAVWRCSTAVDASREVSIAKVSANEAYVSATLTAHQLHGGVGFAVDHDLHLWSDRARAAAQTLGTTDDHLRLLGRQVAAR